jgi:hypothetical protein
MQELTMSNNLKVPIQHQVNFTIILLTELEIIFMFVFASRLLVKNSEIVSENSLHYSMNAQLIGFCLGLKRL